MPWTSQRHGRRISTLFYKNSGRWMDVLLSDNRTDNRDHLPLWWKEKEMIDKKRKKQFVAEFSCFLTDLCNDYYMNGHDDGYADGLKDKNMDLPVSWDDAYRRGLEDAWKTALQIANMTMDECKEIFGDCSYFALVAYNYTADQAMKKIMDYEHKKKTTEKPCAVCIHCNHGLCVQPKKKPCRNYSLWEMRKESHE